MKYLFPLSLCRGPEGTPFEGGVFVTELIFPTDYPLSPPKMKFTSEMFHPNGKLILGTPSLLVGRYVVKPVTVCIETVDLMYCFEILHRAFPPSPPFPCVYLGYHM